MKVFIMFSGDISPKDQYHSAHEVDLAISLGALRFNTGISKCMNNTLRIHASGLYEANRSITADQKEKRKINRYKRKKKLDAYRHREGNLYKSEKFHSRAKSSSSGKICSKCGKSLKKGIKTENVFRCVNKLSIYWIDMVKYKLHTQIDFYFNSLNYILPEKSGTELKF